MVQIKIWLSIFFGFIFVVSVAMIIVDVAIVIFTAVALQALKHGRGILGLLRSILRTLQLYGIIQRRRSPSV